MNTKKWISIHEKEPKITLSKNILTVENVRDFKHPLNSQPTGIFAKKKYNLNKLTATWFAIDPLNPGKSFAHTFFSFQFGKEYLVISVEARRKKLSDRPALWGFLPLFKLYYSAATEEDMFTMRCRRKDNLQLLLFKLNITSDESRKLILELQKRMNYVHQHKVIFNSVYRNCTTEILNCFDKAMPGKLGHHWRRYLTGHIGKYLLTRGLITSSAKGNELNIIHNVKKRVISYKKGDFSAWIRKDI